MSIVFPITDDPRYRRYTASAGQTVFSVPFPFMQNEDLKILLQTAPSEYEPFEQSDYTLTGANNPAGGSVTLHTPRQAGDVILILGDAILDRMGSIVRDGKFSSALTDSELDRIRIIEQEFRRDAGRALKVDYGGDGVTLANNLENGRALVKDGDRLVNGPAAAEIASAQSHAETALAAKQAAALSAIAASSSAVAADNFANAPEDAPLGGGKFSGRHYLAKVEAIWQNVITGLAAAILGAPEKEMPADADLLAIVDSEDDNALKHVTYGGLRQSLQSDFDFWALQPVGVPFPLWPDAVPPPIDDDNYRYVCLEAGLTGSGQYNEGVLINEDVSGSAPLIVATADIDLEGSPLDGETVHLLNTEARIVRPSSSPGALQDDAFQGHGHEITRSTTPSGGGGNGDLSGTSGSAGTLIDTNKVRQPIALANGTPRTANETRMRNIGVCYYMRIK